MRTRIATFGALLVAFALSGCLLSLTESFEYNVTDETGSLDLAGTDGDMIAIDLSDEDTFADNKDKLKLVDRLGFEATLYTRNSENAKVDVYFREKSTDPWMLLLDGATVAGSSSDTSPGSISYEDSESLIKNFSVFQEVALGGIMELRVEAEDGNDQVTVTNLLLIITITAGT